nr:MAG TPA: Integrase [Caudoviricetes sp.]
MMMKAQCRETYRGDITARELRDLIILEAEPAREKVALLRDGFIAYESRNLKKNTINRYKYTWAKIEAFLGKEKAACLTYDEINRSWLEDFDAFMAKEGLSRNTRTSRMLCVAAVFNLAIDNEQTKNYPFRRYSLRIETTKKRDLSVEEIRSIFEAGGDELVDMFLLMFLLIGINVRDLFALTKENIVRGRLEYDRAKTGRHYSILLHPEALRIIEKYKGEKKLLRFSEHFKTVDSATVMINKKLAKVRQGLTTYYARHTWASIAFNLGIPKDVVSLALGHSFGVRVTDTYINADLSRVDEANRRVIDYVLYNKK